METSKAYFEDILRRFDTERRAGGGSSALKTDRVMIDVNSVTYFFISSKPVDMRKGRDKLAGAVQATLKIE